MNISSPWSYFRSFYSANHTQQYLKNRYQNFPDSDKLAFQNCYTLIYYIQHGKKYYDQSITAPYELQPVLLFYGMIQLMKALILTVDPNYPETTQVLAHGVTTRKRKKSQYEFLMDEVKIQKNGLISHFSDKLFHMKQLESEKFNMDDLMKQISELHPIFKNITKEKISIPLTNVKDNDNTVSISSEVLDILHLTANGFNHYLNEHTPLKVVNLHEEKDKIYIKTKNKLNAITCSPIQFNYYNQKYYLPIKRKLNCNIPEVLVHYLILYNLSMICRYETEWWGELFHTYSSNDLPFITEFLDVTKNKVPYYLSLMFQRHN
ncbi:hypothetical protein BKP37_03690 [Anaerobacillus alkalilacustris]|uniref:YaaC-like Protein n=1 Tax=Anaerobacillus alkalilacustris TaxID=393763 RepID=A0A1S2LYN5_9BACI|nr:YaaC family protein [Anaerobacillus alkalilacustris]OIJ17601.1 hypothetical protein BKP37_03690 [Anaerobacillus alkalilacustris]